jgi:hypothetical protein
LFTKKEEKKSLKIFKSDENVEAENSPFKENLSELAKDFRLIRGKSSIQNKSSDKDGINILVD